MFNKRVIVSGVILLGITILIIVGVKIYPSWRAERDETYVPPVIRKRLLQKTEITDDMYLPVNMIQAIFELPEDKRHLSPEAYALQDLFLEIIGNEEAKTADQLLNSSVFNRNYSDDWYYLFIEYSREKSSPYVRFNFSIKKWNHLSYCFDYYPDGSIVRQSQVQICV